MWIIHRIIHVQKPLSSRDPLIRKTYSQGTFSWGVFCQLTCKCVTFVAYRFWRAYIDGYSALGVVYEVSLEVVMTARAWCAGDAGIAIWRARLSAGQFRVGSWMSNTWKYIGMKYHSWLAWLEFIYQHYTTRNQSDIDHNVNNEADGPCKWIYVIIGTDFCCIRVFIIIGLSKVIIRTAGGIPSDPLEYIG